MVKSRSLKPEFYKCFMQKGFFPNGNKITKYEESSNYWIFKTGETVYKVKKKEEVQSTIVFEEQFCNEIIAQTNTHSAGLNPEIGYVKKNNSAYVIENAVGSLDDVLFYVLIMKQLPDRYFLDKAIKKGSLKKKTLEQVCLTLAAFHQMARLPDHKDDGTPDKIRTDMENLFYQSKKHVGVTISQAMIDIAHRPMDTFLKNHKKLFLRRIRNQCIRYVHGCFIPRKIHVHQNKTLFLARTSDPFKDRYADVATDIADLTIELLRIDAGQLADQFTNRYIEITGDQELGPILKFYQVMKCLAKGLKHSVDMERTFKGDSTNHLANAKSYYEQAIDVVHQL